MCIRDSVRNDLHVAELARDAKAATLDPAAEHDPAADTGPEVDHDQMACLLYTSRWV